MEKVLEVRDLQVEFKNKKGLFDKVVVKRVLEDIDFDIYEGEIVGLVGESGSGKSTIAKSILNLIPYSGSVQNYSERPQMVFQDPYSSLNPSKKIGWLLDEALRLDGVLDKDIRKSKIESMITLVGLETDYLERYPRELSGGQRQRVCLALALMQEPKLLIADEPVSALDVTIQTQVLELLKELHDRMGLSILFISHDLRVVYNVCDRVLILKQGRIVEEGTPKEVYSNPQNEYTKQLLASI